MNRTTEQECPDCSGFHRCDYHEGVRHGREEMLEEVQRFIADERSQLQDQMLTEEEDTELFAMAARRNQLTELRTQLDRIRDSTNNSENRRFSHDV